MLDTDEGTLNHGHVVDSIAKLLVASVFDHAQVGKIYSEKMAFVAANVCSL